MYQFQVSKYKDYRFCNDDSIVKIGFVKVYLGLQNPSDIFL